MRSRIVLTLAFVACLVATNLATMAWTSRRGDALDKSTGTPVALRYPLISQQAVDTAEVPALESLRPLREQLVALVDAQPLRASVYIEVLNPRAALGIHQSARFWPASLAKVPIAIAAMKAIEHGAWSRTQTFPLVEEDRQSLSSDLYRVPPGTLLSVSQLLEAALERSDNTAYKVLLRNLPPQELDNLKDAIGLDDLFDAEGRITVKEYSRFFESLYASSYLRRPDSQYLLDLLNRSNFNKFLRKGLPSTVPFAHKWGSLPQQHTYGDVGIVYAENRPYLIAVLVQGKGSPSELDDVERFMRDVAAISYEFLTVKF